MKVADEAIRLPKSATQIYELASRPETDADELVRAIEVEPGFAAKMLRLANSPIYSPSGGVVNIEEAILRLGRREVAQLAIAMSAGSEFSILENELLKLSSFWKHSLTTAVLTQKILKSFDCKADGGFCAGLLHDLGLMVMFYFQSSLMADVLDYSLESERLDLVDAEKHMLGFDHTEVGSAIAENWGLPDAIAEAIRYHHSPAKAKNHIELVHAVAFANALESADFLDDTLGFPFVKKTIQDQIASIFDLEVIRPVQQQLINESKAEAAELLHLF